VEPEKCDYTGNNWSHRNSNKKMKRRIWNPYLEKNSIDSLQKTAILGTSQIMWKVLHSET
jgi:hypothetical protein